MFLMKPLHFIGWLYVDATLPYSPYYPVPPVPPPPPQLLIPEECPVADDVDCEKLARLEMTGGHIKSAVFRAAARAALRIADERKLMMDDLEQACEEECGKGGTSMSFRRQDSLTQGMYN